MIRAANAKNSRTGTSGSFAVDLSPLSRAFDRQSSHHIAVHGGDGTLAAEGAGEKHESAAGNCSRATNVCRDNQNVSRTFADVCGNEPDRVNPVRPARSNRLELFNG